MISFVTNRVGFVVASPSVSIVELEHEETHVGECVWCGSLSRVLYRDVCYDCSPAAWREGMSSMLGEPDTDVVTYRWPWLVEASAA